MRRVSLPLRFWLGAALAAGVAQAQNPALAPAPLTVRIAAAEASPGDIVLDLASAQHAAELGFSTAAREAYERLLVREDLAKDVRNRVALGLATAEIAAGRPDAAEAALLRGADLFSAQTRLRRGLIALLRRDPASAAPWIEALRAEELPAEEAGWLYVAQAMLADTRGQFDRAQIAYGQAESRATSELARAQILLARERSQLLFGQATAEQVQTLQRQIDQFQGRLLSFTAAGQQAVVLDKLGRKVEAEQVLQRTLALVPTTEREASDRLRLLLALIAGPRSGVGRAALQQLFAGAAQPEMQRIALQLLAGEAGDAEASAAFRRELDAQIALQPAPRILDDLLLYRARLALAQQEYERAEADARALLANFPGSPDRVPALNVLVSVAWELRRYRTATDAIAQLQAELGTDSRRGPFAVLLAESFFRATDYRNAAGAYAQALAERTLPPGATRGALMYQQVLALLRADPTAVPEEALDLLDRLAGDPDFDPLNRWQAEWNTVKTLQVRGQIGRAYDRLNRVLATEAFAAAAPELKLRMGWLQAKLSLEAGRPAETLGIVDRLLAGPAAEANAAVPKALREETAGTARLVRAQALLALGREADGMEELEALRRAFPGSDPAVYSFIIQAKFLSDRGQTVDAQQLLIELADRYADSPYAAYALYEAAGNAERRGEDRHYEEAFRILQNLVDKFPRNELVFYAQLKQGDLLRKLDQLGPAQVNYEAMLNRFATHPDAPLAELALADTLFAQVTTDSSRLGSALARYERLFDLPSAPGEVRAEAGFKAGYALAMRGNSPEARRALWVVADRFLIGEGASRPMGEKGRYWLGRALLLYAELSEKARGLEEARNAYELVLRSGVWGENTARAALARLSAGG
ncbi:MAG TPA: hypothetical protein VK178_11035 [Opitutaceae bacterium]|nr:hypothetical protein [Opitutaceae bacterium]